MLKCFSSSGYIDDMAAGTLRVAVGYGGDLNIAKNRAKKGEQRQHRSAHPATGVGIRIDSLTIPKLRKPWPMPSKIHQLHARPDVAAKNPAIRHLRARQSARAQADGQSLCR